MENNEYNFSFPVQISRELGAITSRLDSIESRQKDFYDDSKTFHQRINKVREFYEHDVSEIKKSVAKIKDVFEEDINEIKIAITKITEEKATTAKIVTRAVTITSLIFGLIQIIIKLLEYRH